MNMQITLAHIQAAKDMIAPLCDGDEDLFADMMEAETDIDRFIARLHEQIARDEEMLVGIKDRKATIAERESRIKARKDKMKAMIGHALRVAGMKKIELPEATYSVRDGNPKLVVVDDAAVPETFKVAKFVTDKAAINEAFAEADTLPNWLAREDARDVVTARTK